MNLSHVEPIVSLSLILIDLKNFKSSAYRRHSEDRQNLTSLMKMMKSRGSIALP